MAEGNSNSAVTVAVIGLVGVIAAAVIANWSQIFGPKTADATHAATPQDTASTAAGGDAGKTAATGNPASAVAPPATGDATQAALSRTTFVLPGDGTKNNNQSIGPFCCTGETVTVRSTTGSALGYVYFYDFDGGYNVAGNQSATKTIKILVSGPADLAAPDASQVKDQVAFAAASTHVGSSGTVVVGHLRYRFTVTQAQPYAGLGFPAILMDGFGVSMDVALAGN